MSDKLEPSFDLHCCLDGEATPEQLANVQARLQSDPAFAAEYLETKGLKQALVNLGQPEIPSQSWEKCRVRLAEIDRAKRTERFVGKYAWGLCGLIFCLIIGGGLLNRLAPGRHLGTSDLPAMTAGLLPESIVDHPAPDAIGHWLMQSIGAAPVKQAPTFQILQAEMGQTDQGRFARLTLQDQYGKLALFIFPNRGFIEGVKPLDQSGRFSCSPFGDANCVTWAEGSNLLILVGQRSAQSLRDAASEITISN